MKGSIVLETDNITAMKTSGQTLLERLAHIAVFQEHGMRAAELSAAQKAAREAGREMEAGPVDPEHSRKSGGVGIVAMKPLKPMPIKHRTLAFKDAELTGRLKVYAFDVESTTLQIAVLYGWTGALKGNVACHVSERMTSSPSSGRNGGTIRTGPKQSWGTSMETLISSTPSRTC